MTESLSNLTPGPARQSVGAWIMALTLFALTLALDTRHNAFPFTYHPDEGGKVAQVIAGSRNFHHPLLLLQATEYVARIAGIPHTPQTIVETGRWVSAAFAAGAVVAFALIAWWYYGLIVGWGAGLAVCLQSDLFELAHYMKEDPALLFGLALALFAAHLWWHRPSQRSLWFLAIACGLATAGKYLGIVALGFALPLVIWHRASDALFTRAARLRIFATVFVVTFLLGNFPLFGWKVSSPFRSIGHEVNGVAGGHLGLTRKVPHAEYLHTLESDVPAVMAALAAVYAIALVVTARRRTPPEWITLLFPLVFLGMLSCSPKIAGRYLLPVSAMIPLLAALGAGEVGRFISAPHSAVRNILGTLASVALLGWACYSEVPRFQNFFTGFQHDDPAAVANWIKANLPADAVIAEDHRVNLSASKSDGLSTNARVPQKVLDAGFAPELGTLDELRAKGVTYVAICRQNYGRYFNDDMKPQASVKSGYDKNRDFYARVIQEGQLVKEWPKGPKDPITYLQPGIKLYRIAPTAAPSSQMTPQP